MGISILKMPTGEDPQSCLSPGVELQPDVFWDKQIFRSSLIEFRRFSMRLQGSIEIVFELVLY